MNPKQPQKLKLNRETLTELSEPQQSLVQGGLPKPMFSNSPFNPCHTIWTCARGGC